VTSAPHTTVTAGTKAGGKGREGKAAAASAAPPSWQALWGGGGLEGAVQTSEDDSMLLGECSLPFFPHPPSSCL
jgi:hypothetical protein